MLNRDEQTAQVGAHGETQRTGPRPRRAARRDDSSRAGRRHEALRERRRSIELQPGKYQPRTHMDAGGARRAGRIDQGAGRDAADPGAAASATGGYEIIAGERRWRAARMAGLDHGAGAGARTCPTSQALAMALIENIQREDLNPLEEAAGIQRLDAGVRPDAPGDRRDAGPLARRGDQSAAAARARAAGAGAARCRAGSTWAMRARCSRCPVARQIELAQRGRAEGTHGARSRAAGRRGARKAPQPRAAARRPRCRAPRRRMVATASGTTVQIKPRGKRGGKLVLAYRTLDELDQLLAKLRLALAACASAARDA